MLCVGVGPSRLLRGSNGQRMAARIAGVHGFPLRTRLATTGPGVAFKSSGRPGPAQEADEVQVGDARNNCARKREMRFPLGGIQRCT